MQGEIKRSGADECGTLSLFSCGSLGESECSLSRTLRKSTKRNAAPQWGTKGEDSATFFLAIHAILLFDDKHWHKSRFCLLKLCELLKEKQAFCHGNSAAPNSHPVDSSCGPLRAHVQIAGATDLDPLAKAYLRF